MNQPSSSLHRTGSRLSPLAHSICALVFASLGVSALAADAVFSSGAFTGDADSGVSTAKTYVALGNIVGGDVTVNGATFLGTGLSGTGWALTGVPNQFGGGGNHTTTFGGQAIAGLFDGFQYNGNPGTLTMSGLTAGKTYVVTLYDEAWVLGDNRFQTVTSSAGASILYNEDALEASALRYTFVATGATTVLNFAPLGAGSMHFYGVSNEQVFNNSWGSGASWTTAAWSGGVPNGVGKNADFAAQGVPTAINLDTNVTVGHVQFNGANAWTVSGANTLTLQADAGGTSVLSALSGTHTIATPVQINSPLAKFGAGTVRLTGAIAGAGKGVTVGSGALVFQTATTDLSSVGNIANSGALSIINAGAQGYGGTISGTGSLVKSGAGTLTLSGVNTYSGSTTVSAGTLLLGGTSVSVSILNAGFENTGSLGGGGWAYSPTGADWTFNGAGISSNNQPWVNTAPEGTHAGFIQGVSISQTVSFGTSTTYNIAFQGANRPGYNPTGLLLQVDGVTVSSLPASGFLTGAVFQQYNFANVTISAGSHNIAFVGNNTFGGDTATAIDAISIASAVGALPSGTALNITTAGASVDLNGHSQTIGSLAGVAGTSVQNIGTFTVGGDGTSTSFAGVISGSGSFTKAGNGILTLSGANLYGGGTTITGGTLRLAGGSLPTGTALSLPGSGATFDLNGGTLSAGSLSGVAGSAVTLGNGTLTVGSDNSSTTFAGALTGAGGSLVKNGSGVLTLSGANNYSGGTNVAGGTLKTAAANAAVAPMTVAGGATWDLGAVSHTITGLSGGGSITRTGTVSTGADGSTTISIGNTYVQALAFNNVNLTINGVSFTGTGPSGSGYSLSGVPNPFAGGPTPGGIGGGAGYTSLLQNFYYGGNPGVLTFTGLTLGKAYEAVVFSNQAWGTRVENATFASGSDSQQLLGTNPANFGYYSYKFVADGSTVSITMAPLVPSDTYHWYGATLADFGTTSATLTLGNSSDFVFSGNVSGPTSIVKVGSGTQELNGGNTYTGSTAINGGSLQLGSGTLPGAITGIGKLIKSGSGLLTLSSAANTYSGGTDINGGTLKAAAPNATGTGAVTVATNAFWDLGVVSHTVAGLSGNGTVVRTGGVITLGADGAAQISAANNYLLKLDFGNNGGATVNGVAFDDVGTSGAGWSLAGAGNLFGEGNLSGLHTGYDQLVDDFYYNGSPGVLTFDNLTIGKTYSAVLYTQVGLWGGRPQTATFDEDGAGPVANQVTFDPGDYGYQSYKFIALSSSLSISMAPANAGATYHWFAATLQESAFAAATLTVGDANNYAFSGVITGATNLVKQGIGTQTLSGANTYSGFTAINNGVLSISASSNLGDGSATNTITINGGKLRDTSAGVNLGVNRAVTIGASGATIDVTTGASLTVPGAISGPGNSLTKTGAGTLTLSGSQTYATLNANAGVTNLNSVLGTGSSVLNANSTVNINASQNLAALNIAAGVEVTFGAAVALADAPDKWDGGAAVVPEPGALGLLLAGALGWAARRRRGV